MSQEKTKLSRADRKQIEAAIARAKNTDKRHKSAQDSIPFQRMFPDGICRVTDNYYSKTVQFQDINYQLNQNEDKTAIFDAWCDFLNYFDSSIHFQLSFVNLAANKDSYAQTIAIPPREDAFNQLRAEYTKMLQTQLARGNNGLIKTKFITFGVEADNLKTAKPRLERIEIDILNNFKHLGVQAEPLNGHDRLKLMHDVLHMQDVPVFMLYADSTEEMALDMEDIEAHPGMYGVERNEWDMMRGIEPQAKLQEAEKRFLETPQDAYLIYQIKTDGAYCDFRFEGTEYLKQYGIEIDRSNYDAIYTGKLPADGDTSKHLNDLFYTFNLDHPADFQGHSLSVNDIVALKQNGVISCHYVDTVGFKEVPGFLQPENYLKNAEMAMEDDYGMIDCIINNGPRKTVAELEEQSKTGTPISLLELAQAVQREDVEKRRAQQPTGKETPGKKPSILAKLKAQPAADTTSLKSAPKRSAEREL